MCDFIFSYLYGERMPGGGEFLMQMEMSVLSHCPFMCDRLPAKS